MAQGAFKRGVFYFGAYDFSADTRLVNPVVTPAVLDTTNLTHGARARGHGLDDISFSPEGFLNLGLLGLEDVIMSDFANLGDVPITLGLTGGADGEAAHFFLSKNTAFELGGQVGDMMPYKLTAGGQGTKFCRGRFLKNGTIAAAGTTTSTPYQMGVSFPLSGCMVLDYSTGIYTDFTDAANNVTVNDVSVHPVSGVSDELIILADAPFDKIDVIIGTSGVGTYAVNSAKYSQKNSSWNTIGVSTNTTSFKDAPGNYYYKIDVDIPTDWKPITVNGATGYGIKLIFNAGTVTTAPLLSKISVRVRDVVPTGKKLYGVLHVLAASGTSPTLDVVIQSDYVEAFSNPTTRLTFSQKTVIGYEWATPITGPIVDGTELADWWRISMTLGGTTPSFTFVVAMAIE